MLKPGTTFGAYTIIRELGRGGMGEVYEAEHAGLHKRVALKVMRRLDDDGERSRQRFLREGRAAARVRHEHVVDVTDVGVHDDTPFLVMELLSGESLAQLLAREGPLTAQRLADIMVPVACAVAAAHDAGVLHRDLKPENILLSQSRRGAVVPKVVDFGVSRIDAISDAEAQRLTGSTSLVGTPSYLAPEAVLSADDFAAASDQYALGVVLYECVTGVHPFQHSSLFALLSAVVRSKFAPPSRARPDVEPTLEAVIVRAMRREPADRFEGVRLLAGALLPFASEATRAHWRDELSAGAAPPLTPSAPPPPDAPRDLPRVPTSRALAVGAAITLLASVTFLAGRATIPPAPAHAAVTPSARAPSPPPAPVHLAAAAAPPQVTAAPIEAPQARPTHDPQRAPPRAARPAPRPSRPAPDPDPSPPQSTSWSLRTRF